MRFPRVRIGAVAAGIVFLAGAGLGGCAGHAPGDPGPATSSAAPAKPATPAQDMVEIDMFSGRQNPTVVLDAGVAKELYLMIGDQEVAGRLRPGDPPDAGLGFRGFVLTPTDHTRPALRILPTTVFIDRVGGSQELDDPSSNFYNRVYAAIRPLISGDVRAALPDSNPAIPQVTATIPPQQGVTATWTLAHSDRVNREATSIDILVTRLECANGTTGELMEPVVSMGTDDIVVRTDAVPNPPGGYVCPANDSVAVTVTLSEPIGDRTLIDAACLAGDAVRTSYCQAGAIRWAP